MVLMDLFTLKCATDHSHLLTDVPDVQLPEKNRVDKQLLIPINSSQIYHRNSYKLYIEFILYKL